MNAQKPVVLVTGSSGLIGYSLCQLLAKDYQMIGFDRDGYPYPPPEAECVCVDLSSDRSVKYAFERVRYAYGEHITSVIHLAAYYSFSGEASPLYEKITVRGTERMLLELQNFQVEQFVFSSTELVHAPTVPGKPINEDSPLDPKWDYPKSKVETEKLIHKKHGNIPVVILRIAGIYNDQCESIPLAHQIQRIYERQITSKLYPGDITHGQAFVHLDDVLAALRLTIERRHELPRDVTMIVGEPETLSYDELQRAFGRLIHGEEWETREIPKTAAKAGAWLEDHFPFHDAFIKPWMIDRADDHYELDITRARTLLGWAPKRSLRETLPKMVAALKADPEKFYCDNKLGEPPSES
ncbi:MAG TPA: NAD(P)-dependent oxidoreductase [Candidatus Udaeobacter sp.]|nr:NAD(P)-dependent oxidoreductase [Candidatus Udaeobacter sp.]